MKISNSKKQLAKIISENGGWPEGAKMAAQQKIVMSVEFWTTPGKLSRVRGEWIGRGHMGDRAKFLCDKMMPNHHQATLSRDEYFHLYPAPDADGWIEWGGGNERPVKGRVDIKNRNGFVVDGADSFIVGWDHDGTFRDIIAYRLHNPERQKSTAVGDDETNLAAKEELEALELRKSPEQRAKLAKIYAPSIEKLAADYRAKLAIAQKAQEEADSHRCGAEAALEKMVAAGKALGLVLSIAAPESELVITDWRDLQVGDIIECLPGSWGYGFEGRDGQVVETEVDDYEGVLTVRVEIDGEVDWGDKFKFIRRP